MSREMENGRVGYAELKRLFQKMRALDEARFASVLFTAQEIMLHRPAIGLNDEQRDAITRLIRIKNLLTPQQQEELKRLREGEEMSQGGAAGPNSTPSPSRPQGARS